MQHKKPATQLAVQDEVRGHEGSPVIKVSETALRNITLNEYQGGR